MKLTYTTAAIALLLAVTGCASQNPTNAATWANGSCSTSKPGTTLTIDFKGQVKTHCALEFTGNSWDLLKAAGFNVRGTDKYPTAFACLINGQPSTAKCDGTDPVNAYWAYLLGTNGKYDYATTGASDHKAVCGTSEAWVFTETATVPMENLPTPTEFNCK